MNRPDPSFPPTAYRKAFEEHQSTPQDARGPGSHRNLGYAPPPAPLPEPVIDNHTHLNLRHGSIPLTEALDAASAVGVPYAVQVGFDLPTARFTVDALDQDLRLRGAIALHPNEAPIMIEREGRATFEAGMAEIAQLAEHPRVRAIGETGLDYFRTAERGKHDQRESFIRHIDLAKRLGLALQIHDRDAHEDVVAILESEGPPDIVIFHCFSGDRDLARRCNDRGWRMSFSGTVTYKNNHGLREALQFAEPELILAETDAPFLPPVPYRGRPNASYMLPYTVRSMAETRQAPLPDFCHLLYRNTDAIYGFSESSGELERETAPMNFRG